MAQLYFPSTPMQRFRRRLRRVRAYAVSVFRCIIGDPA